MQDKLERINKFRAKFIDRLYEESLADRLSARPMYYRGNFFSEIVSRYILLIDSIIEALSPVSSLVLTNNMIDQKFDESICVPLLEYMCNTDARKKLGKNVEVLSCNFYPQDALLKTKSQSFDFIYADLPLNWGDSSRMGYEIDIITEASKKLSQNGILCFVHGSNFTSTTKKRLKTLLEQNNFGIRAILSTGQMLPNSAIYTSLVVVGRQWTEETYVSNIEDIQLYSLYVDVITRKYSSEAVGPGSFVKISEFVSYENHKIKSEADSLASYFPGIEMKRIEELSNSIRLSNKSKAFEPHKNAVYFPKVGISPVVREIQDATIKEQNLIQIILNDQIHPDFFVSFFRTKFGLKIRESMHSGGVIPFVSKTELSKAFIPVPRMQDQMRVIESSRKLQDLQDQLHSLQNELSLNPLGVDRLLDEIDKFSEKIASENRADQVRTLIHSDESKTLEFKETYRLCTKTKEVRKDLEDTVMKTIAGFLNSDGGTLLIGVRDNKEVSGIDIEIDKFHKGSVDKFLLQFSNTLKARIGEQYYPFIEYTISQISSSLRVFVIHCKPSDFECWLDNSSFYVRTNPATYLLEGPKITQYCKTRFAN